MRGCGLTRVVNSWGMPSMRVCGPLTTLLNVRTWISRTPACQPYDYRRKTVLWTQTKSASSHSRDRFIGRSGPAHLSDLPAADRCDGRLAPGGGCGVGLCRLIGG